MMNSNFEDVSRDTLNIFTTKVDIFNALKGNLKEIKEIKEKVNVKEYLIYSICSLDLIYNSTISIYPRTIQSVIKEYECICFSIGMKKEELVEEVIIRKRNNGNKLNLIYGVSCEHLKQIRNYIAEIEEAM